MRYVKVIAAAQLLSEVTLAADSLPAVIQAPSEKIISRKPLGL